MSVPHSGTRTLVLHLGIDAAENGLWGAGRWWHFGSHEDMLAKYRPHVHIPIRHPMDVARSWGKRDKTGDVVAGMLRRYAAMFAYLDEHEATFHRMEDLQRREGMNEHVTQDRTALVRELQEAVTKHVVEPRRAFFEAFYEDLSRGFEHVH